MTLFDPLGLAAHIVIKGKILLREVWRSGVDWDEPVSPSLEERWKEWCDGLGVLDRVEIPRHYGLHADSPRELHVFVDASESAFAAAAYIRGLDASGIWICQLIMAKTRVAPLGGLTMPRMELQAAVMGARLAATIENALTNRMERRYFWSDSEDVIHWIESSHRRYHAFVRARINEILDNSREEEWRWTPSELNVADDATRFTAPFLNDRWLCGPPFLTDGSEWPKRPANHRDCTGEELHPVLTAVKTTNTGLVPDATRFNNWQKLVRVTAYALRFFHRVRGTAHTTRLVGAEEWARAEEELFRAAQLSDYESLVDKLRDGTKSADKSHPLYRVSPLLDEKMILRVDGRLPPSFPLDVRRPIILPPDHRITELYVASMHARFLHANHSTVLNELRQRVYVPGLRNLVKTTIKKCLTCRLKNATPCQQQMGPLPPARAMTGCRPFTYCGVDYFGPMDVVILRRHEKRWVALFTCLTTRAIHMEVAHSLDANSCLMCLRNMMARRNVLPVELWSDNGTNFHATNNELGRLADRFPAMKWRFNPPGAPHMGGVWERMIRTVKTCLAAVIGSKALTDETLRCALAECEWVVNSHPLTDVSLEPEDDEALTPHHFLNGGTHGHVLVAPGAEDQKAIFLRKSWRIAQQIADHFWRRFAREVVPVLNLRTKWFSRGDPLQVGDQVLMAETGQRGFWKRGRVCEVITGRDGRQVRQVRVKTADGSAIRPAVRLAKLDLE